MMDLCESIQTPSQIRKRIPEMRLNKNAGCRKIGTTGVGLNKTADNYR
jgi:hypothetical protein